MLAWTERNANGKNSNILMMDLAGGTVTNLTAHTGDKMFRGASFSPDGKSILMTSNALNGYDHVALLEVATKKIQWLTEDRWEMSAGGFSPDGKRVTWTANVDGRTARVVVFDPRPRRDPVIDKLNAVLDGIRSGT